MSHRPDWHNRIVWSVAFLVVIASIFLFSQYNHSWIDPLLLARRFNDATRFSLHSVVPPVFLAFFFLYLRRLQPVAWAVLAICAARAVTESLYEFSGNSLVSRQLWTSVYSATIGATVILALLLPLLPSRWRWLQPATAALIIAEFLFQQSFTFWQNWLPFTAFEIADSLFTLLTLVGIVLIAWLSITRRAIIPHRPPCDARAPISLPCPRCSNPLSLNAEGDQCPHCRLQIFIALDEGRCQKCHYALRGLTSPNCPECGTPIASPTTANSAVSAT